MMDDLVVFVDFQTFAVTSSIVHERLLAMVEQIKSAKQPIIAAYALPELNGPLLPSFVESLKKYEQYFPFEYSGSGLGYEILAIRNQRKWFTPKIKLIGSNESSKLEATKKEIRVTSCFKIDVDLARL